MDPKKKELLIKKSTSYEILVSMEAYAVRAEELIKDYHNKMIDTNKDVFYLLCEVVSSVSVLRNSLKVVFENSKEVKEDHYSVVPEQLVVISSALKTLDFIRATLIDEGLSIEEM